MEEYKIPDTEQGLNEMVRYAEAELKRMDNKYLKLKNIIFLSKARLQLIKDQKEKECIK